MDTENFSLFSLILILFIICFCQVSGIGRRLVAGSNCRMIPTPDDAYVTWQIQILGFQEPIVQWSIRRCTLEWNPCPFWVLEFHRALLWLVHLGPTLAPRGFWKSHSKLYFWWLKTHPIKVIIKHLCYKHYLEELFISLFFRYLDCLCLCFYLCPCLLELLYK